MRYAAILTLALLVPACGGHHIEMFTVTVANQGTQSARIEIIVEYEIGPIVQEPVQPIGTTNSYKFSYEGLHQVHITAFNDADNTQIFDAVWSTADIQALNSTISIAVAP